MYKAIVKTKTKCTFSDMEYFEVVIDTYSHEDHTTLLRNIYAHESFNGFANTEIEVWFESDD